MVREEWLRDATSLGGLPVYLALGALFLLVGNPLLAIRLGAGLVIGYAVTVFFRVVYFKKRPVEQKYTSFLYKIDASAFPSLHALRGAVLWALVALSYNIAALYIVAAVIILSVAWTRVYLKRHDPIDVSFGVIFGLIIAYAVFSLFSGLGVILTLV